MVNWDTILRVWMYPLAILAPVLDGLSTYLLLNYAEETSELNSRVAVFHTRLGLAKGQAVFSSFATLLWVGGVHVLLLSSGVAFTSLMVGMYLGFSLKQLYDGYTAYAVSPME